MSLANEGYRRGEDRIWKEEGIKQREATGGKDGESGLRLSVPGRTAYLAPAVEPVL